MPGEAAVEQPASAWGGELLQAAALLPAEPPVRPKARLDAAPRRDPTFASGWNPP